MKLRFLAAIFFLLSNTSAYAMDSSLVIHGISYHSEPLRSGKAWNGANFGLGVRVDLPDNFSAQGGLYRDSLYRDSAYLMADLLPLSYGHFHSGGFVGVKYADKILSPIGGAVFRYSYGYGAVALRVAPIPKGNRGVVIAVEVSRRF